MCYCSNMGLEQTLSKSQLRDLTLVKKILPPLLPGLKLATFRLQVQCFTTWAFLTPDLWSMTGDRLKVAWSSAEIYGGILGVCNIYSECIKKLLVIFFQLSKFLSLIFTEHLVHRAVHYECLTQSLSVKFIGSLFSQLYSHDVAAKLHPIFVSTRIDLLQIFFTFTAIKYVKCWTVSVC